MALVNYNETASQIIERAFSFVDKTMEVIISSFSSSIFFQHSRICRHFFCLCVELIYQNVLKAGGQNFHNVFRPKKMKSSPFLRAKKHNMILLYFENNRAPHYESRHVSVTKTVASRKTHLHAIMISRCQGDDIFVAFQPMGTFRFWRNVGIHFFQKMSRVGSITRRCSGNEPALGEGRPDTREPLYSNSIFLGPHPLTSHASLPVCAGVQFSRDSLRAFNDRIKIQENRGL